MTSTRTVNFSVRQNKAIERFLAFDSLRQFVSLNRDLEYVYVGLGSVWFVDFDMAHRDLSIDTMISIESNEVVFRRAQFNKPFHTVEVIHGNSHDIIPEIMSDRPSLLNRPWIVWLDYDDALDSGRLQELEWLVNSLPANSALVTTFNAQAHRYGQSLPERRDACVELFGTAFPTEEFESNKDFKNVELFMSALASAVNTRLNSRAVRIARPGGFIAGFNLRYQDGSPMVTAGGVLPGADRAAKTAALVKSELWRGVCETSISTPPLTIKEVQALRALMPVKPSPTRADVQALGFDLEDDQVASYMAHYKSFPTFVQAMR